MFTRVGKAQQMVGMALKSSMKNRAMPALDIGRKTFASIGRDLGMQFTTRETPGNMLHKFANNNNRYSLRETQNSKSGLGKRSFSTGPGQAKLDGKIALVTGASTGIGKAIAKDFAKEGAKLVLADVNDESGKALVEEVKKEGAEAIYVHCNVAESNEVKQLVQQTIDTYGRLDVACNNAGIEGSKGFVADCTEENWDSVLNINLKGVFLCMKHEIPAMIKAGGGTVVNLSSVAGVIGFPSLPAYVASKHGIVGITKNAALEYAKDNIRVNAVCPGGVHTEMLDRIAGNDEEFWKMLKGLHPMGRISEPHEIANAVTWLSSSDSSFTTGQSLPVDGGFTSQ